MKLNCIISANVCADDATGSKDRPRGGGAVGHAGEKNIKHPRI